MTIDDIDFPDWLESSKGVTMPNDEEAQLPRTANTPRKFLRIGWAWAKDNPGVTIPLLCFMAGMVLGAVVF